MFGSFTVVRCSRTRRTGCEVGEKVGKSALCFGVRHGQAAAQFPGSEEANLNNIDQGISVSICKGKRDASVRGSNCMNKWQQTEDSRVNSRRAGSPTSYMELQISTSVLYSGVILVSTLERVLEGDVPFIRDFSFGKE